MSVRWSKKIPGLRACSLLDKLPYLTISCRDSCLRAACQQCLQNHPQRLIMPNLDSRVLASRKVHCSAQQLRSINSLFFRAILWIMSRMNQQSNSQILRGKWSIYEDRNMYGRLLLLGYLQHLLTIWVLSLALSPVFHQHLLHQNLEEVVQVLYHSSFSRTFSPE